MYIRYIQLVAKENDKIVVMWLINQMKHKHSCEIFYVMSLFEKKMFITSFWFYLQDCSSCLSGQSLNCHTLATTYSLTNTKEGFQMTEGLKTMETPDNDVVKSTEKTSDPVLKQVIKNDSELHVVIEVEACVDELLETAHKNVDIKLEHEDGVKAESEVSKELSQSHIALENGGFEEPCVKLENSQDQISLNDTDLNEIDSLACIKQEVLDEIENGAVSSIVCDDIMRAIDQNFEEIDKILLGNSGNLNDLNVEKVDMVELENTLAGKTDPQKIVLSDVLSAVNQYEKTQTSDIKTEEIGLSEPEMENYGSDSDNESVDIELDIDEWDFPAEFRHQSLLNKFGIYDCYIALEDINVIRAKTPEKQVAMGKKIKAKCMKNDKKSITQNNQNLKETQQCEILEPVSPKAVNVRAMRRKTNQQTYIKRKQTKHLKQLKNLRSDKRKCTKNIIVRSKVKIDHKNDTEAHNYRKLKGGKNNKTQRDTTFKCHICSTHYGNLKSLQSHKKIHWNMEYICKFCGPICRYMTKAALENHLMLHGKADYECSICNKIFPNERKLKLHGIKHGIMPYKCEQCPKAYQARRSLEDQKRTHTNERPFKCQVCEMLFTSSSLLHSHSLSHAQRKFPCGICGKFYKRKEHCKKHMELFHSDTRPFKCSQCDKTYKYKASLCLHRRSHTGERETCDICQKSFRDPGDLKKHYGIHTNEKKYQCDDCGMRFRLHSYMVSHVKRIHTDQSMIEKKFKCAKCWKCFEFRSQLNFHMQFHSDIYAYKCKHCAKPFKTIMSLKQHTKRMHERDNERIECQECGKFFTAKEGLRKHMKYHTSGKRFKCSQCGMAYVYKSDLTRHIDRTHNKIPLKRYTCNICGKQVTGLKKHLESHDKSKPFPCGTCGRGFRTEKMRKIHSLVHLDKKPYHCDLCNISFTQYGNWNQHLHKYQHQRLLKEEKVKALKKKAV